MSLRLGIIGAGSISKFHILAARNAGFRISAICASENSKSALRLKDEFGIDEYYTNSTRLINSTSYDCIAIITQPEVTMEFISKVADKKIPILIEKPVSMNSHSLIRFKDLNNVLVAYNRRYYNTIAELKKEHHTNPGIFKFVSAEFLENTNNKFDLVKNEILKNTVHMLDLIRYILGDISLENFTFFSTNLLLTCNILQNKKNVGQFSLSFNSKKNTCIDFENPLINIRLSPVEKLKKYDSFNIKSPDGTYSYTRYKPIFSQSPNGFEIIETGRLKPGFQGLYEDFKSMCLNEPKSVKGASILDALSTLKLAEQLVRKYEEFELSSSPPIHST
jgi:predicted dehydrogenase